MRTEFPLEELRDSPTAFRRLVEAASAPANGELGDTEALIRDFEERYEMTSERMRELVAAGKREETMELCSWLMLLKRRERLAKRKARSN